MPDDPTSISGEAALAWDDYLECLREAAKAIAGPEGARDGLDAAEGFRFLTRLQAAAADMMLENGDRHRPGFTRLMTPTRKFFGDCPDTIYDYAPLSGRKRYRIRGSRGSCLYLGVCVYGGAAAGRGRNRIVSNLADNEIELAPDGSFEVLLSPDAQDGNWLRLEPDVTSVVVRQYFHDRAVETPAGYTIEPLEPSPAPPPLDETLVARRLRGAGTFVRAAATVSAQLAAGAKRANEFSINSADSVAAFFPTPDNQYVVAWYRIASDEALVIEGTPPAARYWSITLMNRWMESLDYRHRRISINDAQASLEADDSFRFVIAHADPGTPNWLDAAGHREGYVILRALMRMDDRLEEPTCRVTPLESAARIR